MRYLLEVIACSVEDALAAEAGGADRIELTVRLDLAGLTPPVDMTDAVARAVRIPVRVMLRPNDGLDFRASEAEIGEMQRQIAAMSNSPIEGLICGFLDQPGRLDFGLLDRVLRDAPPRWRLTVHRAFDYAAGEPEGRFAAVHRHGRADRILSGGSLAGLEESLAVMRRLHRRAAELAADSGYDPPLLLAGGGLMFENLPRWVRESGCREFHLGRAVRTPEETTAPVDAEKVRHARRLLDELAPPGTGV